MTQAAAPVMVAPARNGRGLFALGSLRPGSTIMRVAGRIVHYELLWNRQGSKFAANCFRYGPDTYLDPGEGIARFLNHSCEPNAGIRKIDNRLLLFAARSINRGSEVTMDYSTTIGDDDIWRMRCNCGHRRCRRMIRNFGSLPAEVKHRYLTRGLVPGYIIRTLAERVVHGQRQFYLRHAQIITDIAMRKQYYFRPSSRGLLAWDVDRLVQLSDQLPRKRVPLSAIRELDEDWVGGGERPTWSAMIEHIRLIEDADLSFPIILSASGSVMDGMHRVTKAALQGRHDIEVVQFDEDPEPDHVGHGPEELPY